MKSILSYFIKYPVAVNIIMIAVAVFGVMGALSVKSSFFPLSESNIINITVAYPGASPIEMEEGVVLKIEDNLRGLVGIDRVTSKSSENTATITVETFEDAEVDVVLANVKNAVDRVPNFPVGMEPPIIAKRENVNEAIAFTISGDGVPLKTIKSIARNVESDIRALEGVSQLELSGFPAEEIEIAVREQDLRAFNLTFNEVSLAVANANILTTGGNIKTSTEEYLIRANNRAYYGDELDYIVVRASPSGEVIRLKDIATVRDQWSENPDRLYYNGNTAIQFKISTTNNEDLVNAADQALAYIEKFNQQYDNVQLSVTRDASITIKQRTKLLAENGAIGIFLVLIFLSLFLKPSIALWVAIGLPFGFFGMFILAPGLITINVLSLFGMIIVIGILVDDGIVIGENIYQHYEKGKTPIQAAIDGTMEVIPPIVSAILTTIIAFSTFFFLQGRIGKFFSEVSTVVVLTLSISLIEALIILPSHIAHSRALKKDSKPFILNIWADKAMNFMRDRIYAPVLRLFLKNQFFGFSIPIALFIVTVGAISSGIIKIAFFPSIASDQVKITLRMPQGTPENLTDSLVSSIEAAAWRVNEVYTEKQNDNQEVVINTIRQIGPGTSNATLTVNLLPGESRDFTSEEITNAIEKEAGSLYGIESLEYGSGSNFGGKPISVSLISNNIQEIKEAKVALKAALKNNEKLKDISDNDPSGIKEISLELKDNAYQLGLNLNTVMSQVRSGFFGRAVQRFQRGRDEIRVWVRYDKEGRNSIKNLDDMWIVTNTGSRVPLSEIASYSIERGEIAINHLEGQREIKVEANMKNNKDSAPAILAELQSSDIAEILSRYPSVTTSYEGQNREAGKVANSAGTVLPIILLLIYVVIAFTFRSFSQPLLLFVMVPFSLIGVAWGHYLHGFPINILSWLGIIALIGIVVNDGLVLIGKFNSYLKEGKPFEEALFQAGKSRFRAIFLTSLTTIAGLAPLILETSRQAQFLIPMAISISYGIFIATFLTLFMLPLLLSISNSIKVAGRWLRTGVMPRREEVERALKEQKSEEEALVDLVDKSHM